MKIAKKYIATTLLAILTTPVALANDEMTTRTASHYFDANWTLSNSSGQPYPPVDGESADISSKYFDANWAVVNTDRHPEKQQSERVTSVNTR